MIKAGRPWSEEVRPLLDEVKNGVDVPLVDLDYLQLVLELVRAGKTEEAKEVAAMMPFSYGAFLAVRHYAPQIVYAGATEIAFDLYRY